MATPTCGSPAASRASTAPATPVPIVSATPIASVSSASAEHTPRVWSQQYEPEATETFGTPTGISSWSTTEMTTPSHGFFWREAAEEVVRATLSGSASVTTSEADASAAGWPLTRYEIPSPVAWLIVRNPPAYWLRVAAVAPSVTVTFVAPIAAAAATAMFSWFAAMGAATWSLPGESASPAFA